ncbi:MAG TPA: GNAT family N-acetyltransferase [Xanthomonadaceae bacterium]|nr:GNAT family N-acetyltransferase [Xanthomonadaceae bacterium]
MPPDAFRIANDADLDAIVDLLADDAIARTRSGYVEAVTAEVRAAFASIQDDPDDEIWVGERDGQVVAALQLTILSGLSRNGMRRALVEAVRVSASMRGQGIGERLMQVAMDRARERGCGIIQLTSDLRRTDAHRFYARLGFEASHVGMKRML